jgi:Outer membrane protein beta-barrel domain
MSLCKLSPPAAAALLAAICTTAPAQDAPPSDLLLTRPGWEIGGQISNYRYEEPVSPTFVGMNLKGPRIGGVAAYTATNEARVYSRVDVRVSYGRLDYKSGDGNSQDDVPDWTFEVRAVVGRDYPMSGSFVLSPYIGLGYRYLYSDLRGYNTVGNVTFVGYRRYSEYLYAPIGLTMRMRAGDQWVFAPMLEYDAFIGGKQKTKLSDTGLGLFDAHNDQDEGRGYRVYLMMEGRRWTLGPYLHYWKIKESDVVLVGFDQTGRPLGAREPENWTREYGLEFRYRF